MLRYVLGAVALGTVGYLCKENEMVCKDKAANLLESFSDTLDEFLIGNNDDTLFAVQNEDVTSSKFKNFHKEKKSLYKRSIKLFVSFAEKHHYNVEDVYLQKIPKESIKDDSIDEEMNFYINKILNAMKLQLQNLQNAIDQDNLLEAKNLLANQYLLAHLKLQNNGVINEEKIYETLLKVTKSNM